MVWVPKANLAIANDTVTADLLEAEGSQTRAAAQGIVNPLVKEAMTDPNVTTIVTGAAGTAATAAVAVELTKSGVFHGIRKLTGRFGKGIAFTLGGKFTWLQTDMKGNPPRESAVAIAKAADSAAFTQGAVVRVQRSKRRPYAVTWEIGRKIAMYLDWTGSLWSGDGTLLAGKGLPKVWTFLGDSTTFGADLLDYLAQRFTTLLTTILGITINNAGQPSARSDEIAARGAALRITATVTGGTIPAVGGSVVLTGLSVDPLRGTNIGSFEVDLATPFGQRIRGILYRTDTTVRTFVRTGAGAAVAATSVSVDSATGRPWRNGPIVFAMGINDEPLLVGNGGTRTIYDVQNWYRALISTFLDEWFHWGLLDRGASEGAGTVNGDYIRALEKWFAAEHGDHFIPIRLYLASAQAVADAAIYQPGFTPTAQDNADLAAGCVPQSFRFSGSVHLNPLGHQLQAAFLASWFRQYSRYASTFTLAA
ncbi:hypothetical protein B7R22_17265 [Subtercola boreus]|uniref:Uncharacterized protein n=1 Tax=Subtercola boreus TaxID=120213 RepID=A0A3E0VTF6_9MICO|nr:hypothetical protein [Subtercola boreus]RFA12177.1 hypothetical protein B7R22_17265 [Subtercola boreus]